LVFSTGDTDDGFKVKLDFTSVFIVTEMELLTVCSFTMIVIERDWPALTALSNGEVRHTSLLVVED
jgi:hypothetical protein